MIYSKSFFPPKMLIKMYFMHTTKYYICLKKKNKEDPYA